MSWKSGTVNVGEINYPVTLGGGNEVSKEIGMLKYGCNVIDFLVKNNKVKEKDLHGCNELIYNILSSVHECNLFHLCQESSFCSNMARAMQSGEYILKPNEQPIKIGEPMGNYLGNCKWVPYEGKHRICIAKQFGVKALPLMIYEHEKES